MVWRSDRGRIGLIFLFGTGICLSPLSCSVSQSPSGPIPILTTPILATVPAFTAENFLVPPVYAVLKYQGSDSSVYTDYADTVLLKAFSDTKCTSAAKGTLTLPTNPIPLTSGIAQFSTITFTLPDAQEQVIYLGASLTSGGLSICGPAVTVLQHFNKPYGMLAVAAPNASGSTATATGIVNEGRSVAQDSSGRYVVAGVSKTSLGGTEVGLWRYLSSGSLDTTFTGTGFIHFGAPGSSAGVAGATGSAVAESVVELKIDSNGKYVILGTSAEAGTGGVETVMWRVSADGTFDGSFGQVGVFRSGTTGLTGRLAADTLSDRASAMAQDSSGRWIIVGESKNAKGETEAFAIRVSGAGILDTGFGSNGVFRSAGAAGGNFDRALGVDVDSSGNIWIVGSSNSSGGGTQMALWKLSSAGAADQSFGAGTGVLLSGVTGAAGGGGAGLLDVGRRIKVDSSGKLVIAGTSKNSLGGTELALWRVSQTTGFDTTFSASGSVHFSASKGAAGASGVSVNEQVSSLFLDSNNKRYVISGSSANASGGIQAVLWRIKTDGTLDPDFNTSGSVLSIATGISGDMLAATIQDSILYSVQDAVGTYVSVGKTKSANGNVLLAVWRHLPNGIQDF